MEGRSFLACLWLCQILFFIFFFLFPLLSSSDSAEVIPHRCDLFALLLCLALDFFFLVGCFFPERILVGRYPNAPVGLEHPSWRGSGVCLPPVRARYGSTARGSPQTLGVGGAVEAYPVHAEEQESSRRGFEQKDPFGQTPKTKVLRD